MHHSPFFTMQLKEITGNVVLIPDVHLSDTIAQVKLKVQQQNEMHPDSQRLILGGAVLEDHTKTLAGYGVTEETVVMLQAQDPEAAARRAASTFVAMPPTESPSAASPSVASDKES